MQQETTPVTTPTYVVPTAAGFHTIIGLQPNGTYDVVIQEVQSNLTGTITVRPGAAHTADGGGVLAFATG